MVGTWKNKKKFVSNFLSKRINIVTDFEIQKKTDKLNIIYD